MAKRHQNGISFESKTANKVGQQCKEADQPDDQPGLPAPELGQCVLYIVNQPLHAFLPRFERVHCDKFGKS